MTRRAVLFDAGDTLVRPQPSFAELFAQVLDREGHRLDPDRVQACWIPAMRRFHQASVAGETWSTSPERSRRFWLSVYDVFFDELGLEERDGLGDTLYRTFSDPANYGLFPDVPPAIEALATMGVTMGVVSNFEAWLDGLLDSLGLAETLTARAISGVEGIEKPDPSLFTIAVERAGVAVEDCVFVGDSIDFDVVPAHALGMTPVLVDRRDRHQGFEGLRITSLEQLPALVGA